MGVVVLDRQARQAAPRAPSASTGSRGGDRARPRRASTPSSRPSFVDRLLEERPMVSRSVEVADVRGEERLLAAGRGRRCSSAPPPTARTGGASKPEGDRHRARSRARAARGWVAPATTRTTESSARVWIARSWMRKRVGDRRRARARASSSSLAIGSSRRLPLVMTSSEGPVARAAGGAAACRAASTPELVEAGRDARRERRLPVRAGRSTMGRAGETSARRAAGEPTATRLQACARSRAITREGLVGSVLARAQARGRPRRRGRRPRAGSRRAP